MARAFVRTTLLNNNTSNASNVAKTGTYTPTSPVATGNKTATTGSTVAQTAPTTPASTATAAANTSANSVANTAATTPATSSSEKSTTSTTTSTAKTPTVEPVKSTPQTYTPQTYTPTGIYADGALDTYNAQREAQIRQMYADAQKNTEAQLKTAYDQNLSDYNAELARISPQYQQSMNALGAEYERQRRNNNMQAATNGLNSGAGSQMQLAQSANYQANQANLAAKENEALNEANRRILDLKTTYQNAIAEAAANNNYKLAAAMLDEYENQLNRQLQVENTNYQRQQQIDNLNYERQQQIEQQNYTRAWNENQQAYERAYNEENRDYTRQFNEETRDYQRAGDLAAYGDFSGYEKMYGNEIANAMKQMWILQNPQIAWASGNISAEDYFALTGEYPHMPEQATDATVTGATGTSGVVGSLGSSYARSSGSSSSSGGSGKSSGNGVNGYYDIYGNFVNTNNGTITGSATNHAGAGTPSTKNNYVGTPSNAGAMETRSLSNAGSGRDSGNNGGGNPNTGTSVAQSLKNAWNDFVSMF